MDSYEEMKARLKDRCSQAEKNMKKRSAKPAHQRFHASPPASRQEISEPLDFDTWAERSQPPER